MKTRQEEDLMRLNTRIGNLEAENKELVERNERMVEDEKKSALEIRELESKITEI